MVDDTGSLYKVPTHEDWTPIARIYHPLQAGSIDGTDSYPHDKGIRRALCSSYRPNKKVNGDPYKTLFVGRLDRNTSEETVANHFAKYGELKNCRLVRDIITGVSRKYAFVEYQHERDARIAYRELNKSFIDDAEIFVDFEQERALKGWVPRRLGGGFGGRKESGQLRFGGRDRPFRRPINLAENPLLQQKKGVASSWKDKPDCQDRDGGSNNRRGIREWDNQGGDSKYGGNRERADRDRYNRDNRGQWSEWTVWSHCTVTAICLGGTRTRERKCLNARNQKASRCFGAYIETDDCPIFDCKKVQPLVYTDVAQASTSSFISQECNTDMKYSVASKHASSIPQSILSLIQRKLFHFLHGFFNLVHMSEIPDLRLSNMTKVCFEPKQLKVKDLPSIYRFNRVVKASLLHRDRLKSDEDVVAGVVIVAEDIGKTVHGIYFALASPDFGYKTVGYRRWRGQGVLEAL
eukprot:gene12837-14157_t